MYFFTADQHYGHANIIQHCDRPFADVAEMNTELMRRHNEVVGPDDTVIHAGDFAYRSAVDPRAIIKQLNGEHIFLRGNHDRWQKDDVPHIWDQVIDGQRVVVCHYAMRTWPHSHRGSWQLFGHSHGTLEPMGLQWDIGVDNNDFYPLPWTRVVEIMSARKQVLEDGRR